jgi:tripartite-type tricarboxylate transporter receptor subunit TctC
MVGISGIVGPQPLWSCPRTRLREEQSGHANLRSGCDSPAENRPSRYARKLRLMRFPCAKIVAALSYLFCACVLHAQTYPTKPVRIIVAGSSGVPADTVARMIAQPLTIRLGRQVVVDTRPGANTMIGTEAVVRSSPDGHTLLMVTVSLATNPSMYKRIPYETLRDLSPVSQVSNNVAWLVVHPLLPASSVRALIELAKARPSELAFGSGGSGSFPHLAMELLLLSSATRMLHVPYKGSGPATIDLVAGRIQVMITSVATSATHVRAGKLRALAITSATRFSREPHIPTITEASGINYEAAVWVGLLAPAGTAMEIVRRLQQEVRAVLNLEEVRGRLATDGVDVVGSSPDEFADFLRSEITKWAKVIKRAGIQAE